MLQAPRLELKVVSAIIGVYGYLNAACLGTHGGMVKVRNCPAVKGYLLIKQELPVYMKLTVLY